MNASDKEMSVNAVSKIFEDKIEIAGTEMPISLHVLKSFTGRQDIALTINGQAVSVGEVEFRRGGKIWYSSKNVRSRIRIDNNTEEELEQKSDPLIDNM